MVVLATASNSALNCSDTANAGAASDSETAFTRCSDVAVEKNASPASAGGSSSPQAARTRVNEDRSETKRVADIWSAAPFAAPDEQPVCHEERVHEFAR